MADRSRRVLWLTIVLAAALVVTGIGGFVAVGGSQGVRSLTAGRGLWVPSLPGSPTFGTPKRVLDPDAKAAGPSAAGVAKALGPVVGDSRLGTAGVSVVDLETGTVLYGQRETSPVTPASTTKIVTATAALAALGPYHHLKTRVVAGAKAGEVVLVGAGDPTLAVGAKASYPGAARLDELAKQVKAKGPVTRLVYDTSLFSGAALGPAWDSDVVSGGYGASVSALTVDGGRRTPVLAAPHVDSPRSADPGRDAAVAFGKLLGVPAGNVVAGTAAKGAAEIAALTSPPLLWIIERMLQVSDNVIAESLLRLIAIAKQQEPSFAGGAAARKQVLQELGVDVSGENLLDGSGLSRNDRLTPQLLTSVLKAVADPAHPQLRGVIGGLPVAGYSGTLDDRFSGPNAKAGVSDVRAKTGTLGGVSALAGVVMSKDGTQLAFAAIANGLPAGQQHTTAAASALDVVAARLAACGC
jgi:D-alanyl-D-alanine carboxypeptidase/D-alanyl-D-alanine-endopeptidase (penicillin-binding protein 4)